MKQIIDFNPQEIKKGSVVKVLPQNRYEIDINGAVVKVFSESTLKKGANVYLINIKGKLQVLAVNPKRIQKLKVIRGD